MQLLNIISGLDANELDEMETRLAIGKNKQQLLLFQALKQLHLQQEPFIKEGVYRQVFGKPYSEEMDYLWRNEVRNLKNKLFDFLAEREHQMSIEEDQAEYNKWILKALVRRKMDHLFKLEWSKRFKQVKDDYRPDITEHLLELRFNYINTKTIENDITISDAEELLNYRQEAAIKHLLYIIREIESGRASLVLRRDINNTDRRNAIDKELRLQPITNIDLLPFEDDWSRYIAQVGLSYLVRGELRIEALKNALKLLQNTNKTTHSNLLDEVLLLFNIGSGLTALRQHQEAGKYYLESEKMANKYHVELPESLQYMILYNYLLAGEYQKAVDYFAQNESGIAKTTYYNRAITTYCYALLYLGDAKTPVRKAIKHLSGDDKVDVHIRFITIISYLLEQHWQDAKRELNNYRNSNHYTKAKHIQFVQKCFEKYINAKNSPKEKADKVMDELRQWLVESDPRLEVTSLFLLWLKRTVLGDNNML